MAQVKYEYGKTTNGIPYMRFGSGKKTMLFFAGGPGNLLPTGLGATGFVKGMKPFFNDYTIYLVTRKSNLKVGYTTEDMARDYSEMITQDFKGFVDLIVSMSYGGLIAQHFAANYPELFGSLVITVSAHKINEPAKLFDTKYAELINQRKDKEAMALRADVFQNALLRNMMRFILFTFGRSLLGDVTEAFRNDVVIEAQAEVNHDSFKNLSKINKPVLIVAGKDDIYFPLEYIKEMAGMIKTSKLIVYAGGHMTTFLDKRFYHDVVNFVSENSGN